MKNNNSLNLIIAIQAIAIVLLSHMMFTKIVYILVAILYGFTWINQWAMNRYIKTIVMSPNDFSPELKAKVAEVETMMREELKSGTLQSYVEKKGRCSNPHCERCWGDIGK